MPTVHKQGVFGVKIYGPLGHPPPHVHVHVGREGLITIRLGLKNDDPPRIWEAYAVSDAEVVTAFRLVEKYQRKLRGRWEEIHG